LSDEFTADCNAANINVVFDRISTNTTFHRSTVVSVLFSVIQLKIPRLTFVFTHEYSWF